MSSIDQSECTFLQRHFLTIRYVKRHEFAPGKRKWRMNNMVETDVLCSKTNGLNVYKVRFDQYVFSLEA